MLQKCYSYATLKRWAPEGRRVDMANDSLFSGNEMKWDFSSDEKEVGEFWGWLTGGYLVDGPSTGNNAQKLLVDQKELREMIRNADQQSPELLKLLETAANPQEPAEAIVRKSVRLGPGDYLRLYYVRLVLQSSFADVIMEVLSPRLLETIDLIRKKKPYSTNHEMARRLTHLSKMVGLWKEMKPESRDASTAFEKTLGDFVLPEYSERAGEYREALANFVLTQVEGRSQNQGIHPRFREILDEYSKKWREELREDIFDSLGFQAEADKSTPWRIKVRPLVTYSRRLEGEEYSEAVDKYGEETLKAFCRWLSEGVSPTVKETHLFSDQHALLIWEVGLPKIFASPSGAENVTVEFVDAKAEDKFLREAGSRFWWVLKDVMEWMKLEMAEVYFEREIEASERYEKSGEGSSLGEIVVRSDKLSGLIDLARSKASTKDEFDMLRRLVGYRNNILDYRKVRELVEDTMYKSLNSRSVVSFYVNIDLWRMASLVVKESGWTKLTEKYLSTGTLLKTE